MAICLLLSQKKTKAGIHFIDATDSENMVLVCTELHAMGQVLVIQFDRTKRTK